MRLRVFLVLLLIWTAWFLLVELRDRSRDLERSRTEAVAPAGWVLGSGQEKRFEHFLRTAARDIPDGSRVALTTPPEPAASAFYLTRWAIYHLPGYDVVPALPARPSGDLDYWIAYRERLAPRSDLELVRTIAQGGVYRVVGRDPEAPRDTAPDEAP